MLVVLAFEAFLLSEVRACFVGERDGGALS